MKGTAHSTQHNFIRDKIYEINYLSMLLCCSALGENHWRSHHGKMKTNRQPQPQIRTSLLEK